MQRQALPALLAFAACSGSPDSTKALPPDSDTPAETDTDTDSDSDTDTDTDPTGHSATSGPSGDTALITSCADLRFTTAFVDSRSTAGQGDDVPSCDGDGLGRPDVVYELVAPEEADWLVTLTADFPAMVGVYDDCAAPTALQCTEPVVHLTAGQVVYVIVDGSDPAAPEGDYTLAVTQVPLVETDCADDVDEDRDGALDCTDPDCAADAACAFVCPGATLLLDVPLAGTTLGARDDLAISCASGGGPDEHLAFTATVAGTYVFETTAATFPSALALLDGCAGAELACDDVRGGPNLSIVRVALAANQAVVVAVEGEGGRSGAWTVLATQVPDTETDCSDTLDEDRDGPWDCYDADCVTDPVCVEDCDDGLDNDFDLEWDCDDRDCDVDPACVEVCDDAIDNDLDNRLDCLDGGCALDPACGAEACDDGVDNDRDGYPDCRDPECARDVACPEDCTNGVDDDVDDTRDCEDVACDTAPACVELCADGVDNDGDSRQDCFDAACAADPSCGPEVCGDGLDNDADEDPDCQDVDCAFDPACAEDCANGLDDDNDRPADCDDLGCTFDPACAEDCGNGVDDDGDDAADCYDWACATDPRCVPTSCPTAAWAGGVPGQLAGDLTLATDVLHSTCHEEGGLDHSYAFTAPADGTYVFDTYGSWVDTTLYVQDGCGLTWAPLACVDDTQPSQQSEVSVALHAGQTVIVVVDQPSGVAVPGRYVLNVH